MLETEEAAARSLDAADPLASWRERFHLPRRADGTPCIYFSGNSLGLQPKTVSAAVQAELEDWARLGVRGHFEGRHPWFHYHQFLQEGAARVVGAQPAEVVMMNALTVNLHLMMASFYRPGPRRFKILIEDRAFPSDRYAVASHVRWHGYDPETALRVLQPRPGEDLLRPEDIQDVILREGEEIALVMLGAVHFYTGQAFDIAGITRAAQARGCTVGFDLAHAAGNLVLRLHDWNVDFAVWCTYKYLNAGPGSVGGCFVHERHSSRPDLPRLAGWWGNEPATRFAMDETFEPQRGAAGWQSSNAPVLSMAACKASLDLFDRVGMDALRRKSEGLTGYLESLLDGLPGVSTITPRDPHRRGCQLSLRVPGQAREVCRSLEERGAICDFREPDVLRVAPVPFYNSFHEVWQFARLLGEVLA